MIANARIVFDRQYFETNYDDSVLHRLQWRRYAVWFAAFYVLFGMVMTIAFPDYWMVGAIFAMGGAGEFALAVTHRRRWINARLATIDKDKTVHFEFRDTEMTAESPLGSSIMRYCGFDSFTAASNGFFLVPDTGISIYVPRQSLSDPAAYPDLVELLAPQVRAEATQPTC